MRSSTASPFPPSYRLISRKLTSKRFASLPLDLAPIACQSTRYRPSIHLAVPVTAGCGATVLQFYPRTAYALNLSRSQHQPQLNVKGSSPQNTLTADYTRMKEGCESGVIARDHECDRENDKGFGKSKEESFVKWRHVRLDSSRALSTYHIVIVQRAFVCALTLCRA